MIIIYNASKTYLWLLDIGYLFPYIDRRSNIEMSEDNFRSLLLWAVS